MRSLLCALASNVFEVQNLIPLAGAGRYFAFAMTEMQDYEREVAPLKGRLFAAALAPGAEVLELGMGTGPNLRYEAECSVRHTFTLQEYMTESLCF